MQEKLELQNTYRSATCGSFNKQNIGQTVKVAGWVSTIRDHGGVTFIDLRDQSGIVQLVVNNDALMKGITKESVISAQGLVRSRGEENKNPKLKTGEIEIEVKSIELLGPVLQTLPFEIENSKDVREDIRLKYRYLDLRNPKVFSNILFRSKINSYLRKKMEELGFNEITTPILTASSPEGARDYLVPSRLHAGMFYALPQAPQMFKQLLMAGGFDRYFQIAPCFRDEDARADRTAGEFYQLDMEMAFATQDDLMKVGESVFYDLFTTFGNKQVSKPPFRRIPFNQSMRDYGTDKPDLRNPLIIKDCTQIFANTNFNAFKGSTVKAIFVPNVSQPRSFYDNLTSFMMDNGSKGLAWIKVEENNTFNSPIAKFLSEAEIAGLISTLEACEGGSIFLLAGKEKLTTKLAGILRNELGERLGLIDQNKFELCWITEFPLYELTDDGKLDFAHNPFSQPKGGLSALQQNPLDIQADQWDLVGNGIELLSGAVRNHDPRVMKKMFAILGYDEALVEQKFGALYGAFQYGAPPHAGMALGLDRTIMLLLDEPNVREVIAFPLNKSAFDPLTNAPSNVTREQLRELHIKVEEQNKKIEKCRYFCIYILYKGRIYYDYSGRFGIVV